MIKFTVHTMHEGESARDAKAQGRQLDVCWEPSRCFGKLKHQLLASWSHKYKGAPAAVRLCTLHHMVRERGELEDDDTPGQLRDRGDSWRPSDGLWAIFEYVDESSVEEAEKSGGQPGENGGAAKGGKSRDAKHHGPAHYNVSKSSGPEGEASSGKGSTRRHSKQRNYQSRKCRGRKGNTGLQSTTSTLRNRPGETEVEGSHGSAGEANEDSAPGKTQAKRPSETRIMQLVKVYLDVVMPDGSSKEVLAAIDTQSNVTFCNRNVSLKRPWDPGEGKYVEGFNGQVVKTKPRAVTINKNGKHVKLRVRQEPGGPFPDGIDLLLSAQACRDLRIDVNHALDRLAHTRVQYRDVESKRSRRNKRKRADRASKHLRKMMHRACARTCRLAERMMTEYLAANDSKEGEVRREVSWEDVKIDPRLTSEEQEQCRTILHKYKDVFMTSPDDVPPLLSEVEPVEWQLKEGAKPVFCKKPNWGPAQRKYLTAWTKKALKQGLIEERGGRHDRCWCPSTEATLLRAQYPMTYGCA